jgi:hypothetical protein
MGSKNLVAKCVVDHGLIALQICMENMKNTYKREHG